MIVSYNSADFITQTLDSIYNQTYPHIELIISDDGSKDNTPAIAAQWIEAHKERFTNCILLAHEKNQGVAENLNAGIRAATGKYIKDFAADDLLMPTYLQTHIAFLEETGADCVFSRLCSFTEENGEKVVSEYPLPAGEEFFNAPAETQYRLLLEANRLLSPSFLATRALYDRHGLYDTRFPLMEDYPFYTKITKEGTQLRYLDVCLVEYRISATSISNSNAGRVISPAFHKMMRSFFYKERLGGLLKHRSFKFLFITLWQLFFSDCILLLGNDKKYAIVRFLDDMRTLKIFKRSKNNG